MITSEKCNCCVHEPVCGLKEEYRQACEAIKNMSYACGDNRVAVVKDSSFLSVTIRCNHFTQQKTMREVRIEDA